MSLVPNTQRLLKRSWQMANTEPPLAIFVLAGQSNMAGRGGVQRMPDGTKVWDGHTPRVPVRKSSPYLLIISPVTRYVAYC